MLKVLFGGSRFAFWVLTPLLLLSAVVLSSSVDYSSPARLAVVVLVDLFLLFLILGLYNTRRNEWALRCVTGSIFLAYVTYWAEEIREGKLFPFSRDGGVDSVLAATAGLILIGWPCFKFIFRGFDGGKQQRNDDFDLD